MIENLINTLASTSPHIWAFVTGVMTLFIPAILVHRRELLKMKKDYEFRKREWEEKLKEKEYEIKDKDRTLKDYELKISFFDRIMDFKYINKIKDSVNRIFSETEANRFLILIAINGSEDPNIVSVIFEQHKDAKVKYFASARYRNVSIDQPYKNIIKRIKSLPYVVFRTEDEASCLLKDFYELEGVKESVIKFLAKKPINTKDDFIIFSSTATSGDKGFSKKELTYINTEYESSIIPNVKKVLNEETKIDY